MAGPNDSLTPEQRLLQLIEKDEPAANKDPSGSVAVAGDKKGSQSGKAVVEPPDEPSLFSPSAMKGRIAYLKEQWDSFSKGSGTSIDLKKVNQVLLGITLLVTAILVVSLLIEFFTTRKYLKYKEGETAKPFVELTLPEGKSAEVDLLTDDARRNVFVPYVEKAEVRAEKESELSIKLAELMKDYKLAGISLNPTDPKRTFCMIEDIKKNVTSFLKVGDSIAGLTVTQIKTDSVILEHEKEKIELR